jgi:outer membrane protein assembly factor BamB
MNALIRNLISRLRFSQGNIMVFIAMLLVIFGVLGVTMVSLFSTSVTSSATQNDTRRAIYLSEAGVRYAMSELRANDFSESSIVTLNDTNYTLSPPGQFKLNIFSNWVDPTSRYYTGTQPVVDVPEGELPNGYLESLPIGDPDFLLVNFNAFDWSDPDAQSPITGYYPGSATSFQFQLSNDLVVDGQIALAVTPLYGDQAIPITQDFLDLKPVANNIFPKFGGAFTVKDKDFYYKRVDPTITDRVRLMDIKKLRVPGEPEPDPPSDVITVAGEDPIMLTPLRNRLIVSEGRSEAVRFGNSIEYATAIVDDSFLPRSRRADIEFAEEADLPSVLREVEQGTNPAFIGVDDTEKLLTIGGGTGPSLGAVWFRDTRSIGGVRNFCNANGCFFEDGIRVFFLLDYTGAGDGFIFSLINGSGTDAVGNLKNDTASIGGDIERSEMLGYSGDSRLNIDGTQFLDNSGLYRGLLPPKIGMEFDTKVNSSSGSNYCSSSTSLRLNTRNDPGTTATNRDAVQFVYWGNSTLDVPCREEPFCQSNPTCTGDPSYDDNRHNTTFPNWVFSTGGAILSSPIIAGDGTIYVGSNSGSFYARNPDNTPRWTAVLAGPCYPGTLAGGRIYVGTGATGNALYALNSSTGSVIPGFPYVTSGPVTTKPAVGTEGASTGNIYFGSDDGTFRAVNSSGALQWSFTPFGIPQPFRSSPALSASGGTVFFGSNNGSFYARNAGTGGIVWTQTVAGAGAFLSSPVVGAGGTVYVGNDNGRIYAFNGASGAVLWSFDTGAPVRSSPALNGDSSRVYIGSESNILFALDASSGAEIWRFTGASGDIDSAIEVDDANGHIYFGSDDDNVYALYPDGTLKWSFTTGGNVEVKPAVNTSDGTVYAGSSDGNLYSINQITTPTNLKNLLITSSGQTVGGVPVALPSETDWLNTSSSVGPWAVRLEINRSRVEAGGTYAYDLRAWVRQCSTLSCNDPLDPLGSFFEDTRVQYSPATRPPMIAQTINLTASDHAAFERFIFGFTSQTGAGESQTATIRKFQLSFIRTSDPVVTADPQWP